MTRPDPKTVALAMRLKQARDDKGWSVRELGAKAGLDHTTVHRIEAGDSQGQVSSLNKLATALGVSKDWLCGADVPKHADPAEEPAVQDAWDYKDAVPREVAQLLADGAVTPTTTKELLDLCDTALLYRGKQPGLELSERVDNLDVYLCQVRGDWERLRQLSERKQKQKQQQQHPTRTERTA